MTSSCASTQTTAPKSTTVPPTSGRAWDSLAKALQAVDQLHKYRAYDGSGNVESWTRGYVKFADMTTPLSLPKAHWVISTEAGEHVPNAMESNFIRNLHLHNCLGIILTWASLNQGGYGHINTHDPLYLMELFEELDYVLDVPSTARLLSSRGGHNLTAAEQCVQVVQASPMFVPLRMVSVCIERMVRECLACHLRGTIHAAR